MQSRSTFDPMARRRTKDEGQIATLTHHVSLIPAFCLLLSAFCLLLPELPRNPSSTVEQPAEGQHRGICGQDVEGISWG